MRIFVFTVDSAGICGVWWLTRNTGEDFHSAWFNAVIGRFWWNLYDNNSFHKLLMKAMAKRISKMTNFPKFIVRPTHHQQFDEIN